MCCRSCYSLGRGSLDEPIRRGDYRRDHGRLRVPQRRPGVPGSDGGGRVERGRGHGPARAADPVGVPARRRPARPIGRGVGRRRGSGDRGGARSDPAHRDDDQARHRFRHSIPVLPQRERRPGVVGRRPGPGGLGPVDARDRHHAGAVALRGRVGRGGAGPPFRSRRRSLVRRQLPAGAVARCRHRRRTGRGCR